MAKIEKCGVGWRRTFKNKKEGIKISLNNEIFILYENTQAKKSTDPHYVICKFIDEK